MAKKGDQDGARRSRLNIAALLEPFQRYDTEELTQEKKLLIAILDGAVRDVVKFNNIPNEKNRENMESACEWFECDNKEPFSYLWIMEVLEANPIMFFSKLSIFVKRKKKYGRKKDL
jgi:hypothetical protein